MLLLQLGDAASKSVAFSLTASDFFYLEIFFRMAKFDAFFLVILSWLALCHALDFQARSTRAPIEVYIVSFGTPGSNVFESIPQLTISGPSYSLAADELNRRYNQTFHFTYVSSGSASCLSSPRLQNSVDVLADFYYKAWRPGRIVLFVVPGVEAGKTETEWNGCIYCVRTIFWHKIWRGAVFLLLNRLKRFNL